MEDWFLIPDLREKIRKTPEALTFALAQSTKRSEFRVARDVRVVSPKDLPLKAKISSADGQARRLHDLASIELQALELGMRTLQEFPDAPRDFREQLAGVTAGEARHLGLCLDGVEALGYSWGRWNVHTALWNVVDKQDSLLDRILIVHRYLEGAGLDAGVAMLESLKGLGVTAAKPIVALINKEEVDHVLFGSVWYRKICGDMKIDPNLDFAKRLSWISSVAPRREKLAVELRLRAGFTEQEISVLSDLSERLKVRGHHPPESAGLAMYDRCYGRCQ